MLVLVCLASRKDLREVTSCLLDLGLLFGEESCEGDDVGVDRLLVLRVGRHVEDVRWVSTNRDRRMCNGDARRKRGE